MHALSLFLKASLSISILLFLFVELDWAQLEGMLANTDLFMLCAAILVFLIGQLFSAVRYQILVHAAGGKVSLPFSLRVHFIGLFFNQIMLSGLGGDAIKGYYMSGKISLAQVVKSVVADRLYGLFILCAMVLVLAYSYMSLLQERSLYLPVIGIGVLGVLGFPTIYLVIIFLQRRGPKLYAWAARFLRLNDIQGFVEYFLRTFTTHHCLPLMVLSLVVHFAGILTFFLIARGLGVDASVFGFTLTVPLVFLFSLAPISIAGWGVREVGAVWLLGLVGVAAEKAVLISVTFGFLLIIVSLPGLLLFILSRRA